MPADIEFDEQAGAAGKLIVRAEAADDRGIAGVVDQPVVAEIGTHPPIAAELGGEAGHRGLVGDLGADIVIRDADSYIFSIGPRARWGDGDFNRAYFGVSPTA